MQSPLHVRRVRQPGRVRPGRLSRPLQPTPPRRECSARDTLRLRLARLSARPFYESDCNQLSHFGLATTERYRRNSSVRVGLRSDAGGVPTAAVCWAPACFGRPDDRPELDYPFPIP